MEIIDHAATADDEGRVASDAGRSGPQHAANRGSWAERLPKGRGRSVLTGRSFATAKKRTKARRLMSIPTALPN
jgi:hypothetical protein